VSNPTSSIIVRRDIEAEFKEYALPLLDREKTNGE
jgi:hypothetical protein